MAEHEDARVSITSGSFAQNTANARPRAIRVTASMDMVILEFVNEMGPHIAPYGQSHKLSDALPALAERIRRSLVAFCQSS
jgi:hypothetical protein